ncbi:MAG: hypothetical protein WKF57_17025 [Nakamurella sp.]
MKIRELVEPSATCDTRGRGALMTADRTERAQSTSIDADLQSAAAEMIRLGTCSLGVTDGDDVVAVISTHDLLRAALADDDRQLCIDLGDHLVRMREQHVAAGR